MKISKIIRRKLKWLKFEIDCWKSTIEILLDPELMSQLRNSEEDIKAGRVRRWKDVKKELEAEWKTEKSSDREFFKKFKSKSKLTKKDAIKLGSDLNKNLYKKYESTPQK